MQRIGTAGKVLDKLWNVSKFVSMFEIAENETDVELMDVDASTDVFEKAFDFFANSPYGSIGTSGVLGFCTGVALKRIGTTVATAVGVTFVLFRLLEELDVIKLNRKNLERVSN